MAGNEIAQLAAVIKLNDGNVGQKLELIKKGLGQTDQKFNQLSKAVNDSTIKMNTAKIALDKYRSELGNVKNATAEQKTKLDQLNTAYTQQRLAVAQNTLELKKYNIEQAKTATEGTGLTGIFSRMGLTAQGVLVGGLIAVTAALGAMAVSTVKTAGEFEQLAVSFDVLIGNSEKAAAFTNELIALANVTPMTTQGLANNAQMLLAMGESIDNVIPDLKMLGDISGGNQEKMNSLALVFGQVGARGRLTGDNLRQMTELGFNPLNLIAAKTGETMGQVTDRMEKGNISFSEFKSTMVTATSEGGRFFGMMDKQSQTLQGRLSTLSDKWQLVSKNIGDVFLPVGKAAINVFIGISDAILKVQNRLKELDKPLERAKIGIMKFFGILPKESGMVFTFNTKGAEKAKKQISEFKSSGGFSDGLKEPTGGGRSRSTSAKTGKSAETLLNERIQMIRAISDFEIANSKMTDEQILAKKIETQNKITALYKKGSVEYINSQTTSLELTNQLEELKTKKVEEEARKKTELLQKAKDEEAKAAEQVADGITDSLKAAIDGTKSLSEAFKDMLATMAINILKSGLEKKLQALFSGQATATKGGTGVISNALGLVNPTLGKFASMLGFANGGNPPINEPFVVGERGPEIMQVGSSSKVWSNKESASMAGSQGEGQGQPSQNVLINHNINIKAFDSQDVVRTLQKGESKAAIIGITKEAIRNNTGGIKTEVKNA